MRAHRASDAIAEPASFIDALTRQADRELALKFCHVVLPPGMPMNLFGFHVWSIDPAGSLVEPLGGEDELALALIVNQPVELQIENAVAFLYTLAERQRRLAAVEGKGGAWCGRRARSGGRAGTVCGSGPEEIRGWTQQQLALLGIRRYMNHVFRDAEVCGNGYLVFN